MMAPTVIDVWSALGMQSRFIPDSNFQSLYGKTESLSFSRLNGLGILFFNKFWVQNNNWSLLRRRHFSEYFQPIRQNIL